MNETELIIVRHNSQKRRSEKDKLKEENMVKEMESLWMMRTPQRTDQLYSPPYIKTMQEEDQNNR